jgi:hypothetical protein
MKSERQVDGVVFLQSASCWWPREVGYKMIGMIIVSELHYIIVLNLYVG